MFLCVQPHSSPWMRLFPRKIGLLTRSRGHFIPCARILPSQVSPMANSRSASAKPTVRYGLLHTELARPGLSPGSLIPASAAFGGSPDAGASCDIFTFYFHRKKYKAPCFFNTGSFLAQVPCANRAASRRLFSLLCVHYSHFRQACQPFFLLILSEPGFFLFLFPASGRSAVFPGRGPHSRPLSAARAFSRFSLSAG